MTDLQKNFAVILHTVRMLLGWSFFGFICCRVCNGADHTYMGF